MKLCTPEQVQELRQATSRKRRDYDELGPNLYDCWLLTVIRYLERRKLQAASNKRQAQEGTSSAQPPSSLSSKPQASS